MDLLQDFVVLIIIFFHCVVLTPCMNGVFCFFFRTAEQCRIGIPTCADSTDSHANPPAIVIYIVDAFLSSSGGRNDGGLEDEGDEAQGGSVWLLGLLRCYTEMLQTLPEATRPALVLQVGWRLGAVLPACQDRQPLTLRLCDSRWCPASTYCSRPAGRAIFTCSTCARWPSAATPSADACSLSNPTSSP